MKPDGVKCLLNCYLKEKFINRDLDEVDGVLSKAECSIESSDSLSERLEELQIFYPVNATPVVPHLYHEPLTPEAEESARILGRQLSNMSDEFLGSRSRSTSLDSQPESGGKCVQFKSRCVFASPFESTVKIIIVRVGNVEDAVKVRYETKDKTAKAGVNYCESKGEVSFAKGETERTIEVGIVKNQRDRNVSFVVNLCSPEDVEIGLENPATVHITDHSSFVPSEKRVLKNVMNCPLNVPASEVAICLNDDLTPNTFRAALQYRCSYVESIPQELAVAFELVNVSVGNKLTLETLGDIVSKLFSYLPELEDLTQVFK